MGKYGDRRGFTLIELLVVIAIIAIMAAILFPVLMAAKKKGQQANCLGNLKQLGSALQTYITDYGSWSPEAAYGSVDAYWPFVEKNPDAKAGQAGFVAGDARRLWISRYVKSASVMKCPGNFGLQTIYAQIYDVRINHKQYNWAWDYTINSGCPDNPGTLRRPSRMAAWVEENTDCSIPHPYSKEKYGNVINDIVFTGTDITSMRHNGVANAAYADGHAGSVPGGLGQSAATRPDGSPMFWEPN